MNTLHSNEDLVCMVTIINRDMSEKITKFFISHSIRFNFSTVGIGSATSDILDYFGLSKTEKSIIFTLLTKSTSKKLQDILLDKFSLKKPGHGICFNVPISKLGGFRLSEDAKIIPAKKDDGGEIENMDSKYDYELIIVISNRGYSEKITDAAKTVTSSVGATIINGSGIGYKEVEKFLGITITPEKEIILMLTKIEDTTNIIKAILKDAGPHTEARGIAFSLPVTEAVGMSTLN